eukprot:2532579-Amphidinium_carterae.1
MSDVSLAAGSRHQANQQLHSLAAKLMDNGWARFALSAVPATRCRENSAPVTRLGTTSSHDLGLQYGSLARLAFCLWRSIGKRSDFLGGTERLLRTLFGA